jgi:signal transduction histidine kinase
MEQVLVNAFKNAIEAIGEGGRITVKTTSSPSPQLIIRNTGKGIPDDIKPHLFTPFFSTKKNGQGIGLTLIREVLINHGFRFSLESADDEVTEFSIDFWE